MMSGRTLKSKIINNSNNNSNNNNNNDDDDDDDGYFSYSFKNQFLTLVRFVIVFRTVDVSLIFIKDSLILSLMNDSKDKCKSRRF